MKTRLLLCLSLIIGGIFSSFFKIVRADEVLTNVSAVTDSSWQIDKIIQKTKWTETKITLYRINGEKVQLPARIAMYGTERKSGLYFPLVAFVDSQNEGQWIGPVDGSLDTNQNLTAGDYFLENGSEIFWAPASLFAGTVVWRRSILTNAESASGVGDLIKQFTTQFGNQSSFKDYWSDNKQIRINLSRRFSLCFFYPHVQVSYIGSTPVQHVSISSGTLRLDFTSPALKTHGAAWINIKTGKIIRTFEEPNFF